VFAYTESGYDLPDAAVVKEPNRFGPAVVSPYEQDSRTQIHCFMPGAGTCARPWVELALLARQVAMPFRPMRSYGQLHWPHHRKAIPRQTVVDAAKLVTAHAYGGTSKRQKKAVETSVKKRLINEIAVLVAF